MIDDLSLLAVFAHPDDETFGMGGTLARYASEGISVSLICATRGEEGKISSRVSVTRDALADHREEELRCACEAMSINEPIFLDYRDSGMEGTPANQHPEAFVQADPDTVIGEIVAVIRRLRPEVVVTFDPGGGYGHPDHVAIHRFAVAAFEAAGDPKQYRANPGSHRPQKQYYRAMPRSALRDIAEALEASGVDLSEFGGDIDFEATATPDNEVTTAIDVRPYLEVKQQAIECHASQLHDENPIAMMPPEIIRKYMSVEHFILAQSSHDEGVPNGDDLFSGLR